MATKKIPAIRFKGFEGEWEEKYLRQLTDVRDGTHASPKYQKSGFPLVTSKNIKNGDINFTDVQFISEADYIEINKRSKVDKNDILMGMIGTIGNIALINDFPNYAIKNVALIKDTGQVSQLYLLSYLSSSSITKQLNEGVDGGTQKFIALNKIRSLFIKIPSTSEQTQIGNYFKELDGLIGLQEQKLEKVTSLKKAMLEKMFPKAGADVPEIRFKGFVGKWERVKLGDMFDFSLSTNTLSRALLVDKMGVVKNIHYGDILIKYSSCLNVGEENIPFVKDADIIDFKNSFLRDGDVIFADAAEDEAVGKATELYNVTSDYIVSGLHTIVARPLLKFKKYYLGYFLNSDSYHNQLTALMQGTKVLSISKNGLKKTTLLYPSNEIEQQKIGEHFKNLDELISQSNQKIKQLKNLKQAMLQKMFI